MQSRIDENPWFFRLILVVFSVAMVGCSGTRNGDAARGFVETQYTDKQGVAHTYLVFVPYDYEPGQNRPLLLFLHGGGQEPGTDGYWSIHNNFGIEVWELKRIFPFVVAIPQYPEGEGWTGEALERAIAFSDEVAEKYQTDKDRCYVTGVSVGGRGVWNAISEYPDRFAAAVPMCGFPSGNAESIAKSKIPIWNHCNEKDKPDLVDANRVMRMELLKAGASPLYTEYKASGHNCWDRVYRSPSVYEWLLAQRRTEAQSSVEEFQLFSPEEIVSSWISVGGAPWQASDGKVVPPESSDSKETNMLVGDKGCRQFELHLDACLGIDSKGCRLGIMGDGSDASSTPALEIILPLVDQGIGEVRSSNGKWKVGVEPLSQRQLLSDYANDIRLSWHARRMKLYINGCLAVDALMPEEVIQKDLAIRPILLADQDVSWQNIRMRALN